MILTCPHCGEKCECNEALEVGQRIQCPFCNQVFEYAAEAPVQESSHQGVKFCASCGTQMALEARFCPNCGREVNAEQPPQQEAQPTQEPTSQPAAAPVVRSPFDKLLLGVKVAIGLSCVSALASIRNPVDYYDLGKSGTFIVSLFMLGLFVWLYKALVSKESWARLTFIVYTALIVGLSALSFSSSELTVAGFLDGLASLALAYCVFLCFSPEVKSLFPPVVQPDEAMRSRARQRCQFFWGAFVAMIITAFVIASNHEGSQEWIEDCRKAAVAGSESARNDLAESIMDEMMESGQYSPNEAAELAIDLVESHVPRVERRSGSSNGELPKPSKPIHWFWIAKILVVVGGFLGGLLGLNKKES